MSLDRIKFYLLVVLALSLPFANTLKIISLFLLLAVLIVQILRKEVTLKMSPLHYGLLFFLLAGLASSIFAENPLKSIKGTRDILYYTVPFFCASTISRKEEGRTVLWSLYLTTAAAALYGIFQAIHLNKPLEVHGLGNQNYNAMFFVIVLSSMISSAALSDRETRASRVVLGAFILVTLIATVMTAMRASFLALFVFMLFLLARRRRTNLFLPVTLGISSLFSLALFLYKPMWSKLFSFQSLISRSEIWQHAFSVFLEHPFTGIGLNHFKYTFPADYSFSPEAGRTYYDAHNLYLQVTSQMGLPGLAILLLMLAGFLYGFRKVRASDGFTGAVQYGALGGFLVTFFSGIFDTTLHHEHAIAFTLLAGLMFGIGKPQKVPET
ncbi:MAG: O-antigen ligase family protein [Alphaproteobacteria bacterium]|uniref:O-antigen ligase family protein n=1 Tax=Candidatus Nitrobium versatile TaxID=2884831 RepID=A0A953M0S2_9BACT|nr:O-antigen ligase family protein [Candidatus Nitrobium versatile]